MELRKSGPILILSIAILVALFVYSTRVQPDASTNSSLRKELLATENRIPTEAGKKNFLKQSNDLSQKVDPELVGLDSQMVSCDANVDGIASGSGTMSGSCIDSNLTSAPSVKGKYMGGQCCSALMDTTEYHENLEKLQA